MDLRMILRQVETIQMKFEKLKPKRLIELEEIYLQHMKICLKNEQDNIDKMFKELKEQDPTFRNTVKPKPKYEDIQRFIKNQMPEYSELKQFQHQYLRAENAYMRKMLSINIYSCIKVADISNRTSHEDMDALIYFIEPEECDYLIIK